MGTLLWYAPLVRTCTGCFIPSFSRTHNRPCCLFSRQAIQVLLAWHLLVQGFCKLLAKAGAHIQIGLGGLVLAGHRIKLYL